MLFDFADTTNKDVYKLLVATIGPRPIAWVTTQDVDGTVNAAPFSFFNAMSGNPPVVAFGIGGRAPGDVKDTVGNIRRTGEFVVNLGSFDLAEAMNVTAIASRWLTHIAPSSKPLVSYSRAPHQMVAWWRWSNYPSRRTPTTSVLRRTLSSSRVRRARIHSSSG